MAKRRPSADVELPSEDAPRVLTTDDLDRFTSRGVAELHLNRIFDRDADIGEQELILMMLHLLHARRFSLNADLIQTRKADFLEHFHTVFE